LIAHALTPFEIFMTRTSSRSVKLALTVLVAGLAGLSAFALYGKNPVRNSADAQCQVSPTQRAALKSLVRGEIAALNVFSTPKPLPDLTFNGSEGQMLTLKHWRGRHVLLNLWATWCAPCRKEMPALDALQQQLGGPQFEVVAVNIDTRNLDKPKIWLDENKIQNLRFYADFEAKIFQDLKRLGLATGMPTTLVINPEGCVVAGLNGPAEWASADAIAFLRKFITPD
jgi:thiol-disulfide isomerase/thioredoxin